MGGYSDYSECQLCYIYTITNLSSSQYTRCMKVLTYSEHKDFTSMVSFYMLLHHELLGPIVCILSLLLGNQGGMGSSYYGGGGGGGSRGSMNGLGGGWGM